MRLARLLATVVVLVVAPSVVWIAATFLLESALTMLVSASVLAAGGIRPRAPSAASLAALLALRAALPRHHADRAVPGLDRPRAGRTLGRAHRGRLLPGCPRALRGALGRDGPAGHAHVHAAVVALRRADARARPRRPAAVLQRPDKLLFLSTAMAVFFWVMAEPLLGALYGPAFVAATAGAAHPRAGGAGRDGHQPLHVRPAGAGRGRSLHPDQHPALRRVSRRAVRPDPRHRARDCRRPPPARRWPGCCSSSSRPGCGWAGRASWPAFRSTGARWCTSGVRRRGPPRVPRAAVPHHGAGGIAVGGRRRGGSRGVRGVRALVVESAPPTRAPTSKYSSAALGLLRRR